MSNASHHGSEEGESIESSAGPAGGRTPRKKKTRTRDGCLTCRKCKKACDKTKPVCLRCQRLSYACEWPKIKPYSSIGAPRARSERQPSSEEQQHDGQLESSAGVNDLPAFNYSASSSSAASPIIRSAPSSCEGHLSGLTANAMTTLVPGTSPVELFSNIEPLSHQPTSMSNAESPPSNALDAHFWQDNSLYTFDYNFTDFSDIDSLLRLAGLAPLQNSDAASTPEAGAAGSSSTSQAPSNSQILLSKDKLRTFSKMFSPRVVALLDRMIAEQEGSEIQLPLAYIVSICLWAPSSAMRELLQAAKDAYSGPGMHSMLQDLGEVASSILVNKPAKATKIAIEPTEIAAMDISLSSKLFALMDIAFRQAVIEGAGAYYQVVGVMEKAMLQKYKPGHLFNVAEICQTEQISLYNFAYVDVSRSIQLGLPTTFAYHYTPMPGPKPVKVYSVGNSDAIICIASEISALRFMLDRDVNSRTPNGLNPIYQAKADEILQKIHDNPAIRLNDEIVDSEEDFDSVQALSGMAAQEAWRHAALIHYYHSLYRGCARYEHAAQASCQQILKLFTIIQLGRPHRLFGLYGLPIFMAATVAEKLEDQKACLDVFEKLSLKCAMDREIVAFFERIWGDSEKVGRRVEWLDYTSVETGPVFM